MVDNYIDFDILEMDIYPGIKIIQDECSRVYPDQTNPMQFKTTVKFWQLGPDPLDYISCFLNQGNEANGIPPHWHYVSYGLSDLYGDGRVIYTRRFNSGFGIELTMRVLKDSDEAPLWPTLLMQKMASYIFSSGNPILHGDHISWHNSLDGEESRIEHMAVVADPQLKKVDGPFGSVDFVQIVGITIEELQAIQQWDADKFLKLMQKEQICGGEFLITNPRRGESIFDLNPTVKDQVDAGITEDGSCLSGVAAYLHFEKQDEAIHIVMNLEAALLLPLALKGRTRHGRLFTFKSMDGKILSIVPPSLVIPGGDFLCDEERHYYCCEGCCQIYMHEVLIQRILNEFRVLEWQESVAFPKTITFPEFRFRLDIIL